MRESRYAVFNFQLRSSLVHEPVLASFLYVARRSHADHCVPAQAAGAPELPRVGTVFYLDEGQKPVQVHASEVKYNGRAAGNFARSQVFMGSRATVELPGKSSNLTIANPAPTFIVRLTGDDPDIQRNRVVLLHLGVDDTTRAVVTFAANAFGGNRKRVETDVPISKIDVGDELLLEFKPLKPLEPGEYAVALLPAIQTDAPNLVYDFTIPGSSATPKH